MGDYITASIRAISERDLDTPIGSILNACVADLRAVAADSRWFTAQPTAPKPRDYNAEAQAEVDAICTSLSDQAAS